MSKNIPDPLLKALDAFQGVTDRANQELSEMDVEEAYAGALAKAMALENVAGNLRAMSHMAPNSLRIDTDVYNKVLTNTALEITNRAVHARQAFNKIKEG